MFGYSINELFLRASAVPGLQPACGSPSWIPIPGAVGAGHGTGGVCSRSCHLYFQFPMTFSFMCPMQQKNSSKTLHPVFHFSFDIRLFSAPFFLPFGQEISFSMANVTTSFLWPGIGHSADAPMLLPSLWPAQEVMRALGVL